MTTTAKVIVGACLAGLLVLVLGGVAVALIVTQNTGIEPLTNVPSTSTPAPSNEQQVADVMEQAWASLSYNEQIRSCDAWNTLPSIFEAAFLKQMTGTPYTRAELSAGLRAFMNQTC